MTIPAGTAAQRARLAEVWGVAPAPASVSPGHIDVVTEGQYPVLRMRRDDGAWVSANSARAPVREAHDLLARVEHGEASVLIAIGLGLGFLLEALDEMGRRTTVVALEPSAAIVEACLQRRNWRSWIDERRLLFSCWPDFAELSAVASTDPDLFMSPAVAVHPVIEREHPAFVRSARARVAAARAGAEANADARRRFAAPYLLNTLGNLPAIRREADAGVLDGLGAGLPAIVAGAGPSLDRAHAAVREAADSSILIATDTAARPLLTAGVVPHFIVSVDPAEVNGRHLLDLVGAGQTALVAEASLWPTALDDFEGRTFLFRVGQHEPWPWLEQYGLGIGRLRAWGSVITSAVDLALRLGCERVALVGADCAATGGRPYARGTTFEAAWVEYLCRGQSLPDTWAQIARRWTGVREADLFGTQLDTAPHLIAFRDWLAGEGRKRSELLFNASAQGVLHGEGITQIELGEFVSRFGRSSRGTRASIASRHERSSAARGTSGRVPAPVEQWRSLLKAGGLDESLAAHVIDNGRDVWVGEHAARTRVVVSPLAETAALLRALVNGTQPPDWARAGLLSSPFPGDVATEATDWLEEALSTSPEHSMDTAVPFLPSRASGLAAATRDRFARVEERIARRLASAPADWFSFARSAGEPPMHVAPGPRAAAHVEAPIATVMLLEAVAAGAFRARPAVSSRVRRFATLALRSAVQAVGDESSAVAIDASPVELVLAGPHGRGVSAGLLIGASALSRALMGAVFAGRVNPAIGSWRSLIAFDGDAVEATFAIASRGGGVASPVGQLVCRSLQDAGPCFEARAAGTHARLAPLVGRDVLEVDEDGTTAIAATWPNAIVGEQSWGESGLVAWANQSRPAVMWRADAEGPVWVSDLPFQPGAAIVAGSALFLAGLRGGLWTWTPSAGARFVLDTPPVRGMSVEDGGLRLDPVFLAAGSVTTRFRLDRAYRWRFGSAELEPVPLDERGASWSCAPSRDGFTARAFPCASTIEIGAPDGRVFSVICPFPVSVAWAGRSLIVIATTGGEAWMFDRLTEQLGSCGSRQGA